MTCNRCFGSSSRRSSNYVPVAEHDASSPSERERSVSGATSIADEIVALNKLKLEGVLTEEEFKMAKVKLLSKKEN